MPNIKRKIALFATNYIFEGTRPWTFPIKRYLLNWCGYKIGSNTKIVGPIHLTARLTVGENCWIGKNLIINGNGEVRIGNNCDIASEVTFQTGGHKIGSHEHRAGEGEAYIQSVGNGVWIGGRSTILNTTEIGDGSVVAGCACVTKSVPPDTLVGGVPARIIRNMDSL